MDSERFFSRISGFYRMNNWKNNRRVRREIDLNSNSSVALTKTRSKEKEIVIGLLIPYTFHDQVEHSTYYTGKFYASAFNIALNEINSNPTLLPGYSLKYIWNDTKCLEKEAIKAQIYQLQNKIDAFIGPGCHCKTVAKIAGAINIPIISHVSTSEYFSLETDDIC